jgi:hypothetical protein
MTSLVLHSILKRNNFLLTDGKLYLDTSVTGSLSDFLSETDFFKESKSGWTVLFDGDQITEDGRRFIKTIACDEGDNQVIGILRGLSASCLGLEDCTVNFEWKREFQYVGKCLGILIYG